MVCMAAGAAAADKRPNIVLIMADDIGVECLGCYGGESTPTPHIDRLAASGIRFEHAHAQPICTPSRVQIMTGIYNNRNYIKFGLLDPEAVTFGQVLRKAGYRTCVAGKWQLKGGVKGPRKFGFDRYCLWQLTRRPSRYPNPGLEIDGREMDFKNGEFGPDIVSDYACRFIEENKEGPFFLYYPMILTHWPFVPTPDSSDWDPTMWRDAKTEPGGHRNPKCWPGMVAYEDKLVGRLIGKLEALGIRDNTLVIWTGDNGTYTNIVSRFRGRSYCGGKGSTKDNGTHVGFIASWPAAIKAGRVSDSLVDFADVFPTLVDVAGARAQMPAELRLDGVSLAPVFRGKPREKDAVYCWYSFDGVRAHASQHVRDRRYKLYASGKFFDTVSDPDEGKDLAAGGVPKSLRGRHSKLKGILDRRLAVTRAFDPVQKAKRARVRGGGRLAPAKRLKFNQARRRP